MFESRSSPYLILAAALVLAGTIVLGWTSAGAGGWALAGLIAVYVALMIAFRGGQLEPSVAPALDKAAALNAARLAAPRPPSSGEAR